MDFTLDSLLEVGEEFILNYRTKTKRIVKILDLYSTFMLLLAGIIRLSKSFNPSLDEYSNDASFMASLGSGILTSKF